MDSLTQYRARTDRGHLGRTCAGTSTYRRAGAAVTAPVLGDGSASFTPGLSERRGSSTTFQQSGIKSADAQSGASQTLTATRIYDAFGNVDSSTGTFAGYFGYGGGFGYQSDPDSSLKLLGHRYYDASTGRFLTTDPIKDGRNWYGYCGNSPIDSYDPDGQRPRLSVFIFAGDTSFPAFLSHAHYAAIANMYVAQGDDVTYINGPTKEQALTALTYCDVVIGYGHGASGSLITDLGNGNYLNANDLHSVAHIRINKGLGKITISQMDMCASAESPHLIGAWLKLSHVYIGYDGLCPNPLNLSLYKDSMIPVAPDRYLTPRHF